MKSTLDRNKIPAKDIFYFRQRLKNKIFQSALAYFADLAKERNLTKKEIAKSLSKDPAQITRWFAGPNNWTLDTISDLLLAMDAELKYEIVSLHENSQQTTQFPAISENSAKSGIALTKTNTIPTIGNFPNDNKGTKNAVAMKRSLYMQGSRQVSDAQVAKQAIYRKTG